VNRLRSSLLLVFLLAAGPLAAADSLHGEIRLLSAREEAGWVGQEAEIYLELWSDGYSFGDQLFLLPEIKGGYLLQADSSTVKLSENRDGGQWLGLRYTLLLYPQRAGRLVVPAFEVSFSSRAGYDQEASEFKFQTEALEIETRLPPGADSSGLIVTSSSFSMQSSWKPRQPDADGLLELKVGDALTLEVLREAQDVPGMVFAPLPDLRVAGLAVYPGNPRVDDRVNRGSLTGTRNDSVTFVCEQEGRFVIPELRFQWWDPEKEQLAEKVIPSLTLEVAVNPVFSNNSGSASGTGRSIYSWAGLILALALVALFYFPAKKLAGRLVTFLHLRRVELEAGEPWAWRQLQSACKRGSADQAYNAISLWLNRADLSAGGNSLLQLAESRGDENLAREAVLLQERMVSCSSDDWNGRELASLLGKYRKSAAIESRQNQPLSPLNPR